VTTRFSDLSEQILLEHYVNAFKDDVKRKYMQEVWDILQASYAYIGGIKGEEFVSPETMLKVPFWKLCIKDGKIITVRMYKDHNGRKSIAGGTDGSRMGTIAMAKDIKQDLDVGYSEVSGATEVFIKKRYPELYKKCMIPAKDVSKIINKQVELIDGDEFHYKRELGGKMVEKLLLGTPGKKFYGDALDT
jgi:hypothetical protein